MGNAVQRDWEESEVMRSWREKRRMRIWQTRCGARWEQEDCSDLHSCCNVRRIIAGKGDVLTTRGNGRTKVWEVCRGSQCWGHIVPLHLFLGSITLCEKEPELIEFRHGHAELQGLLEVRSREAQCPCLVMPEVIWTLMNIVLTCGPDLSS
jgi:hypothetical protein